jgi:hypothetical protein
VNAVKSSPCTIVRGDVIMAPNLLLYHLILVALVLICLLIHVGWPDNPSATSKTSLKLDKPRRQRSKAPKPVVSPNPADNVSRPLPSPLQRLLEHDRAGVFLSHKTPRYCWRIQKCRSLCILLPSLKAKKLEKLPQEKVLLEL